MLLPIVAIVVLLLAGLLLFSAMKPNSFRLERSTVIRAAPDTIYGVLQDFHRWAEWSPWEKLDADLKRHYAGAASGKGAIYSWEGKKAGSGRMEIAEAQPDQKLLIKLDFIKPMKASNLVEFTLLPEEAGTRALWAMSGAQPFMSKVMTTFISMDKLVGGQFEEGLANLKALSEKGR